MGLALSRESTSGPAEPRWRYLSTSDPELAPSQDPRRSRARLEEAVLPGSEQEALQRVSGLLDEHGAALADRTTEPGHLTGSALVLDPADGSILLLLHTKLRRWLQPGGHADGDHELAGVALREATEETGIAGLRALVPAVDLDIHEVDHGDPLGPHLHLDLRFVVVTPPGATVESNHESLDHRWVAPADLAGFVDEEGIVRLAAAAAAAVSRHPPG